MYIYIKVEKKENQAVLLLFLFYFFKKILDFLIQLRRNRNCSDFFHEKNNP
jgi:hypothetical protein